MQCVSKRRKDGNDAFFLYLTRNDLNRELLIHTVKRFLNFETYPVKQTK